MDAKSGSNSLMPRLYGAALHFVDHHRGRLSSEPMIGPQTYTGESLTKRPHRGVVLGDQVQMVAMLPETQGDTAPDRTRRTPGANRSSSDPVHASD